MNKSSQYNQQQKKSKQCKSEVEELYTYSPKSGYWPLANWETVACIPKDNLSEESSYIYIYIYI